MRVLLVHDYGTLSGGAEAAASRLREGLRARGHQALLFTSTARPLPLPVLADATCFGTVSPLRRVLQAVNPHAPWQLRRVLRSFRPEVVHVKMFLTQLSPLILPLLRPFPSLLHVINYNLICPLNTKTLPSGAPCRERAGAVCQRSGCMPWLGVARAGLQRRLTDLSVFDRIVANSRWVAERLRAEGVPVGGWVWNGVPTRPQRPALGERPVVGFAGRLVSKKGVDVLLRAMAELRRALPAARLLLAGDGPERPRLEALARALGIGGAVDFLGHLDHAALEGALAPAWVQAVPSRWEEPFGLVAAEAMMRGTAVVASRGGGLAEQVVDGETGVLVPAGDALALARALHSTLVDRELAERLGAAGRRRALAELSEERYVERFLAIYEELAGGASACASPSQGRAGGRSVARPLERT
jgi:glycosyltransferase involved in cell wall biosynthesis